MKSRDLKRMRLSNKDPRLNEQIDEIEEMTSRQIAVLEKITDEKIAKLRKGDELPPGRDQAGQGLHRHEAQAFGGRQDGRPPRQQGRDRAHPAGRGHAVPAGWDAGGDRAQSAGRAFAHERGPDSGNPPGLGRQGAGRALRHPGVRRRHRARNQEGADRRQAADLRQDHALTTA